MHKERLGYLDFIKGVAIMMVVYCHRPVIPQGSLAGSVGQLLACFAVPCFMMCSGYVLLFREQNASRCLRRAVQVYVCMVAWKALYLLYYRLFTPIRTDAAGLIEYLFLFCGLDGVETEHLWFLQAYLPVLLITPLLAPMFVKRQYGMIALFTALAYLSNQFVMSANLLLDIGASRLGGRRIQLDLLSNIFPLGGEYSSMLVCFMLGGVQRLMEEKQLIRKAAYAVGSLACFAGGLCGMLLVYSLQTGGVGWCGRLLTAQYEWTSTLLMSSGAFGLLRLAGNSRAAQWLGRHVGQCSMGVYYLHYPLLSAFVVFVYPLLPQALWVNVFKAIVITAASVLLTKLGKCVPVLKKMLV